MPNTTFLAISAAFVAVVCSACDGSSSISTSSTTPATSSAAANPVQRETRPGTPGWEIPADAGTVITGYASEASVAPGQTFHLHVAAPPASRYRLLVYRLGWYQGIGGRLVMRAPGCRSSHAAIAQPSPTPPGSVNGLFRAPWRVTDRVEIPPDAVSGYYEAKLEIVGGAYAGAVGSVPMIVRQSPAAPPSAVRRGAGQYVGGLQPLGRQEPLPVRHQQARLRGVVRPALRPTGVPQHGHGARTALGFVSWSATVSTFPTRPTSTRTGPPHPCYVTVWCSR